MYAFDYVQTALISRIIERNLKLNTVEECGLLVHCREFSGQCWARSLVGDAPQYACLDVNVVLSELAAFEERSVWSTTTKALIAVGAVLMLLMVCCVCCICRSFRKRRRRVLQEQLKRKQALAEARRALLEKRMAAKGKGKGNARKSQSRGGDEPPNAEAAAATATSPADALGTAAPAAPGSGAAPEATAAEQTPLLAAAAPAEGEATVL